MGLLYHTLTDRSSKHPPPDNPRLICSLMADTIFDHWPTDKTLGAGRSQPQETAPAAFGRCGFLVVMPDLRDFSLPTIDSITIAS